jgi:hypothetical protein
MFKPEDKFDLYIQMVIGKRKGSAKQQEMLSKFRYAFNLICEGYTPLQVSKIVAEKYDMSQSRAFKIIQDAKKIFGDASEFSKKGDQYAYYEYCMRMAKKAEQSGDFNSARNFALDGAKVRDLFSQNHAGLFDPMDFMIPQAFVITSDPRFLEAANRALEIQLQEGEGFQVLKDEKATGQDGLSQ